MNAIGAMVALRELANWSCREIATKTGHPKSTVFDRVDRAKSQQQVKRLEVDGAPENKENFPPIEDRWQMNDPRSGRPEKLTKEEKQRMFACATDNKAQRLKTWPQIAEECGFGFISQITIYRYFNAVGYIRAKPRHKPLLTDEQKRARKRLCNALLSRSDLDIDLIRCVDECKVTSGVQSDRMITRTVNEL